MGIKEKAEQGLHAIKEEGKVLQGEKAKDKTYTSTRDAGDASAAGGAFEEAKRRLFDVNAWSDIPGVANARFTLCNAAGERLDRNTTEVGDFIEIDLPGPLPMYWVKVTDIDVGTDAASFTVQPTYNPREQDDKTVTDHFFQDRARSIFRVERKGTVVSASEIGREEAINNEAGEAGGKGAINTIVSEGGWAVFQKYQWKNLTDYLVGLKSREE